MGCLSLEKIREIIKTGNEKTNPNTTNTGIRNKSFITKLSPKPINPKIVENDWSDRDTCYPN